MSFTVYKLHFRSHDSLHELQVQSFRPINRVRSLPIYSDATTLILSYTPNALLPILRVGYPENLIYRLDHLLAAEVTYLLNPNTWSQQT